MSRDRLTLLGTKGGPRLTTGSSWPTSSVAEFAGRPYLVDCGLGVTRQFVEAGRSLSDLHTILITHLHSDHVLELGPLLHTAWTSSPRRTVRIYGPPGTRSLVDRFFELMEYDVRVRMEDERQADPSGMFPTSEFTEGEVFEDDRVSVSALRVAHPPVEHCYALRFRSAGKTVVFSSDTRFHEPLVDFARGADVLVHEVMHPEGTRRICERLREIKPNLMEHMLAAHCPGDDAGRIATRAEVGRLVAHHLIPSDDPATGPREFEALIRTTWKGPLTIGSDLAVVPF